MQITINKEIRSYEEDVFMGLSLKQLLWAAAGAGAAVAAYFTCKGYMNKEALSWLCIFISAPFVLIGFFRYDGLSFIQFLKAVLISEFFRSGHRLWKSTNRFYKNDNSKKGRGKN